MARNRKPLTEEEREERRARDRERLEAAVRELQTSEGWQRWIAVRRENGLSRYSVNNTMLLASQAWAREIPLSYVAGYRRWAELGYQVRKGERALAILGPIRRKVEDEVTGEWTPRVVGFKALPVFDRSQVEAGDEAVELAPPVREPLSGSSHRHLQEPLVAFAASIGSEVSFEEIPGSAGGWFRPSDKRIAIQASISANAELRTLLHEIAHALVAQEREKSDESPVFTYAEEECVVECAGHIAASSVGLDTSSESVAYVAGWGDAGKLEIVRSAAALIDSIARRLEDAMGVHEKEEVAAAAAA